MNICPVCKGNMKQGTTELFFKREKSVIVIENVPALVCEQCCEASIDYDVSNEAYEIADKEIKKGVTLEFYKFQKAAA